MTLNEKADAIKSYHFGGNKSRRILKGKKILKNIQENDTKRES